MASIPVLPCEIRKSISEANFIRATSQQLRAEALRQKLSLGFTYCALAETAMRYRRFELALALIQRTQHIGIHVLRHLNLPNHVSVSVVNELRDNLKQLESHVVNIAERLTRVH